ncbi:SWIM zinc finger domain-containing protein [Apibacter raozihei]|uniref:SWIM zinc finger family protein n=1 Tax=Apibacter raozihei TaxID=2500547 RepID=UPI000FE371B4|nr:SWIM zinc finger family protein [Apibacter raozihei]
MDDSLIYKYAFPSSVIQKSGKDELFLSKYSEIQKNSEAPCYFWGTIRNPFIISRCLVTLSNVVKSNYSLTPAQLALIKDPIVTAGNERIRFEGFSQCAGVYARVDVLPDALDGEFLENGTTNVDFNPPILTALNSLRSDAKLMMSVGQKEVGIHIDNEHIVERKVPLPDKWIRGLSSVQIYLSKSEKSFTLNRVQAQQLFRDIPKGIIKTDYYLSIRGNLPVFSPAKSISGVCVGGLHRLRLLEPLLPYIDCLQIFSHSSMQSTTWQLYFGSIRFSLTLSRISWRGFSGEGAVLDFLLNDLPEHWIQAMDNYSYANQSFNPVQFAIAENLDFDKVDRLTGKLTAMGLLGFDLDENQFFYRRLPFNPDRIIKLNPRIKGAEKLIADQKVEIISNVEGKIKAYVEGSDIRHTILLDKSSERCTCEWYTKYQGERGPCKHVLAVKKMINYK